MSYDSSTILSARTKPGQQQVEVTLALQTGTPNYDHSKGEQIALNVDGSEGRARKEPDALLYPSGIMDKQVGKGGGRRISALLLLRFIAIHQTLTSTKSVSDPSRYAVGILGGSELHITPLASILTLRPDLKYLVGK